MIQSILASKIHGMANRFDLRFFIKQMLATIYNKIDLVKILLVLYTDPYLLYKYLI